MLFAERRVPRGQNREEEAGWWYGWIVLLSCTFAKALKSFGQVRISSHTTGTRHTQRSRRRESEGLKHIDGLNSICLQNNTLFLSIPGIEHDVGLSHTAVGSLMCLACLVRQRARHSLTTAPAASWMGAFHGRRAPARMRK